MESRISMHSSLKKTKTWGRFGRPGVFRDWAVGSLPVRKIRYFSHRSDLLLICFV